MPRPVSIKDQTITDAARAVFLEKGFGATTAEVAERAGVSEGTLFKRFRSKAELFQAAMHPQFAELGWLADLEARVGQGDLQAQLTELGTAGVAFFRQLMPLIMMSYANPAPNGLPEVLTRPDPPPLRALNRLTRYFEAEIRLGRLRPVDPEILARMFLGSLQQYVFFELLFQAQQTLPLPLPTFLRGMVATLWSGAGSPVPEDTSTSPARSPV
ncbi:MAG: TetR/AcrR family transcriptional regulator [Nannocystis sp.]|nr:TetR/AcrR family transcriptional regulator [Nannocystis sp.]MBA3548247.1 TetR/AcrR family transcriptional regulator [Nannocystis sp.]